MSNGVILVVDDNLTNLKLTKFILQSQGYEVHTATDGTQALRTLELLRPDLILMDIQLPGMDGLEVTRLIRSQPTTTEVSIVALTANAMQGDAERAIEAGCDGYIAKPIDTRTFPDQIRKYLEDHKAAFRATENRIQQILIAEDDALRRKLLEVSLRDAGYTVTVAVNGSTALAMALADPPDLVVSDIVMPKMDGFRLCQAIRSNRDLVNTHVILTTSASIHEADERLAQEMGASAFVHKSDDFSEILKAIQQSSKLQPPTVRRIGAEDLEPLRRSFLEEGRRVISALVETPPEDLDLGDLTRSTHRWAGTGGTLGAPRISQIAFELERQMGVSTPDRIRIGQSLAELKQEFDAAAETDLSEHKTPDQVRRVVGGKRIAFIGLPGPQTRAMADELRNLGAVVDETADVPSDLGHVDLIVAGVDASAQIDRQFPGRQCLIVAPPDRMTTLGRSEVLDFIVSPVDPDEFLVRCMHLLDHAAAPRGADASEADAPGGDTVLIIDDDPTITTMLTAALTKIGVASRTATRGDEGLALALKTAPAAIVLDINMPGLSGFEVLEELRRNPSTRSTHVILLTSRSQESDVLRGFELGGDDYIRKPFSPTELLARLKRSLNRTRD